MYEEKTATSPNIIRQANYCQEIPMTFGERVDMYMKCSKLELAKMLAERDHLGLDYMRQPQIIPIPYPQSPCETDYQITCGTDPTATQATSISGCLSDMAYYAASTARQDDKDASGLENSEKNPIFEA